MTWSKCIFINLLIIESSFQQPFVLYNVYSSDEFFRNLYGVDFMLLSPLNAQFEILLVEFFDELIIS